MNQELLKQKFSYDKDTGIFVRRSTGRICGTNNNGYLEIIIEKKRYYCHRLAWLYIYGYFPEDYIDHIDRNKSNNVISNLREVVNKCNIRNTGNFSHNTSGIKGVCFIKSSGKWRSQISVDKCLKFLGDYDSFYEAVCARLAGEQCLNWSGCDKSSPSYKFIKEV